MSGLKQQLLKERADKFNDIFDEQIVKIEELSNRSGKRFKATIEFTDDEGHVIQKEYKFGSKSRNTYFDDVLGFRFDGISAANSLDPNSTEFKKISAANQKRENYRARHGAIKLKDGSKAIDSVGPAALSYYILW